jgi:hypothetical protein
MVVGLSKASGDGDENSEGSMGEGQNAPNRHQRFDASIAVFQARDEDLVAVEIAILDFEEGRLAGVGVGTSKAASAL